MKIFLIFLIFLFIPFTFASEFEFYKCDFGICGKFIALGVELKNIGEVLRLVECNYNFEYFGNEKYLIEIKNCYFDLYNYNKAKYILGMKSKNIGNLDEFVKINNEIYNFYYNNRIDNLLINITKGKIDYILIEGKEIDYSISWLQNKTSFSIFAKKSKLIGNDKFILITINKTGEIKFTDPYYKQIKIKNLYYDHINITLYYYEIIWPWPPIKICIGKDCEYGFAISIPKNESGKFVGIEYNYYDGWVKLLYLIGINELTAFSEGNELNFFAHTKGRINIKIIERYPPETEKRVKSLAADCVYILFFTHCPIKTIDLFNLEFAYLDENTKKLVEVIKQKDNKLYVCTTCFPFGGRYETENIKIDEKEMVIRGKNTKIIYPQELEKIKIS